MSFYFSSPAAAIVCVCVWCSSVCETRSRRRVVTRTTDALLPSCPACYMRPLLPRMCGPHTFCPRGYTLPECVCLTHILVIMAKTRPSRFCHIITKMCGNFAKSGQAPRRPSHVTSHGQDGFLFFLFPNCTSRPPHGIHFASKKWYLIF